VAELKTAGKPVAVRLKLIQGPKGFKADGADLALVEAEVVDAEGNRSPTALNMLNFDLQGAAVWRGGLAQGPDNYILAKSLPVEGGVNRILVRSTTTAGAVVLKVTADGLKSNTLTFASKPVLATNGLSLEMPASGLPSYLKRGPTPNTPSYTVTRHTLKIIDAIAGSNTDKARLSYDDNELSDWFNDGNLATAWINYNLEREALITEVTIKLNNFRSRSYPLRITIDGKEAFNGLTAKTLGYYTIKLNPQRGKNLKIELLDATALEAKDAFGMVEITGKKLDDGVARNDINTKGRLSIVEVEIYEAGNSGGH